MYFHSFRPPYTPSASLRPPSVYFDPHSLSPHDALPICAPQPAIESPLWRDGTLLLSDGLERFFDRSEEHTSELQSRENLVCRLLLEKKNVPPGFPVILRPDAIPYVSSDGEASSLASTLV